MFKKFLVTAFILSVFSISASAQEENYETGGSVTIPAGQVLPNDSLNNADSAGNSLNPNLKLNDSQWRFLGCVHSYHDCEHEAHEHGYHHYRVRRDAYRCDHHELTCYGKN